MTGDITAIISCKPYPGGTVTFGDNKKGTITGIGKIGKSPDCTIDNVFLVDGLKHNLLSVSQLCDKGMKVIFTSIGCDVVDIETGQTVLVAKRIANVYKFVIDDIPNCGLTCLSIRSTDSMLWHKRLGHASLTLINKLSAKDLVIGLPKVTITSECLCDACARGKRVRSSFRYLKHVNSKRPLELLHMDLCGPMTVESRNRKKY